MKVEQTACGSRINRVAIWLCASTFVLLAFGLFGSKVSAQRVRFSDSYVVPNAQIAPPSVGLQQVPVNPGFRPAGQQVLPQLQNPFPLGQPGFQQPVLGQPMVTRPGFQQTPQMTIPQGAITQPPVMLQQPAFDPFAVQQPTIPGTLPGTTLPPATMGVLGMPNGGQQSIIPPPYVYPPPATAGVSPYGYPPNAYPQPGYGQGNGSWSNSAAAWPNQTWARLRSSNVYRLLERPRWRHTYLAPDDSSGSRGLGLNASDIATTLTVPNFLFTAQPIRFSPGFIFNFWDGPNTAVTGADLPGQTYSSYLATDFTTPWDRPMGAELNLTVGLYTDFEEVTSNSVRWTGLGLGWFRLNNTTTFKLGVEYLDRVKIKMLPAFGFFVYPTPDLKLDLYFPRPKLAKRLPNLSNYEVWGYIGGEYGGGSWTIKRISGVGDQVDVNDIRAFIGMEWVGPRRVTGLFEVGYVFNRELVYRSAPDTDIDVDDTIMFRAGIAF